MKEEKNNNPIGKISFKKALRIFTYIKPYKELYGISILFLLLSSLMSMVFPWLLGQLFGASKNNINEISFTDLQNSTSVVVLLFIVFGANALFSFLRVYIGSKVTENVLADIRQDVYKKMITLPMNYYNTHRVGEMVSRISADVAMLQSTFNVTVPEFTRQIIIVTGGVTALAIISLKLTLIMLATIPVMVLIAVFFGRFIKQLSKQAQDKVAESNTIVEETLQAIAGVKAFANEYFEIKRYSKVIQESKNLSIKGSLWRGAFISFIIFCMFGSVVFVIWQGVNMTLEGQMETKNLITFILYSIFIGASFGSIPQFWGEIQKSVGATENLMDILNENSEQINVTSETLVNSKITGKVEFKKVSFSYESRKDIEVLKDITFQVDAGKQIAIVGPSGSGKSTLVSLLLRFYTCESGEIHIDDKNILEYDLSELRAQMAIVPQEVLLFGGSIRENIAYGKPGASEKEIIQAAAKANALEFIEKFPEKFNTQVGDRGVQLSGGQKQRIAIARAVLKNPSILILDEATSSLDSQSEKLVQDALENLMKNRTTFIIAHRLSTIRKADKILVLEKGVLKESGTHEELMNNNNGIYKQLSQLQFTVS